MTGYETVEKYLKQAEEMQTESYKATGRTESLSWYVHLMAETSMGEHDFGALRQAFEMA